MSAFERFKQPEYTGENRCLPCTTVNAILAIGLAGLAAAVTAQVATPTLAAVVAVVVLLPAAASIYLRGYLVPGTPELTKRYFPPWLLSLFGKNPAASPAAAVAGQGEASDDEPIDVESELLEIGAVEPCQQGEELCLTAWFSEQWQAAVETVEADRDRLLTQLEIPAARVEFEEHGDAFQAIVDETVAGTWESRAAFEADLASATVFESTDRWDSLSTTQRAQLLYGVRLFLEDCPCGGTPQFGTETVESCCTSHDVAALTCDSCGSRLFESHIV